MKTKYAIFPSPNLIAEVGRGAIVQLPAHRNDGLEILFLERGRLSLRLEDRNQEVEAGSIFYAFPWEEHGGTTEYESGHLYHFAVLRSEGLPAKKRSLHFPALGFSEKESLLITRTLTKAGKRSWPATPRMRMLMPELVNEALRQGPWREGALTALGRLVIVELCRMVGSIPPEAQCPAHFRNSVVHFLTVLKNRSAEDWTLPRMATQCGVHRTHFINAVSHLTGDTPLQHLRRIRVDRARELLKTTSLSVTEIALECGFQSSQHFARIFHQFTGKTASEYRRRASA